VGQKLNLVYRDTDISGIKEFASSNNIRLEKIEEGTAGLEDVFLAKLSGEKEVDEAAFSEFFKSRNPGQSAMQDGEMIKADALEKKFGDFTAVNKVSFSVKEGEIFGFLGPNGAGKTTTIKMLCGLFPPTSGIGRIAGLDLFKQQFEIKQSIGYMSQKFSLYRDLSVAENIELYGGIYGVPPKELNLRRELILKIADLQGKGGFLAGDLPMGIKQRLALGCSIIHQPRCLFLDEPTSGVDPIARRKFWDIIYILSRQMNVTILVTTHYMDEAEHCDRVSLMTRGQLVALGGPQELKKQVAGDIGFLLELDTDDAFLTVDVLKKEFPHCLIYGAGVHLYTKKPDDDIARVKEILRENNITLRDIRQRLMPFEDVFVYFCERAIAA